MSAGSVVVVVTHFMGLGLEYSPLILLGRGRGCVSPPFVGLGVGLGTLIHQWDWGPLTSDVGTIFGALYLT